MIRTGPSCWPAEPLGTRVCAGATSSAQARPARIHVRTHRTYSTAHTVRLDTAYRPDKAEDTRLLPSAPPGMELGGPSHKTQRNNFTFYILWLGQKPYLFSRPVKCAQTPPILAAGFSAQRSTTAVYRATCRSATTTIACAVLRLCRRAVVAGGGGEDGISAVSKHVAVATAAQVRA